MRLSHLMKHYALTLCAHWAEAYLILPTCWLPWVRILGAEDFSTNFFGTKKYNCCWNYNMNF